MGWPFIQGTMALRASFSILCSITAERKGLFWFKNQPIGTLRQRVDGVGPTFLRAAAGLWTAGAADVAAAPLGAALAAADAEEHEEQEGPQDDQQHRQPVCNTQQQHPQSATHSNNPPPPGFYCRLTVHDELDFPVRVPRCVPSSVNGAEIDPVIPPHHLRDHQVGLCGHQATL